MEKDFYFESIEFYYVTHKLSIFEVKQLNHPFLEKIPKHLYKYRKSGDDGLIDFYVGKRNVYTASFNKLNDVFEGITTATKDRINRFNSEEMCFYYKDTIISILNNRFGGFNNEISNKIFDIIIQEHFDKDKILERAKEFVSKEEQKELKTIISALSYIFIKLETDMNKNGQFAKGMNLLMNTNELMGAYCMCDSFSNENLWALYADNFKGYCIEYDLSEPCKSKGSLRFVSALYPVNYVDKRDDDWFKPLFESTIVSINTDGKANQLNAELIFNHWLIKTLCSKKKDKWSTEHEWRLLGKANTGILGPLVSSIIVGHNICKKDFDLILHYCQKNYFSLKITDIDYVNQEVIVRDLTEQDIQAINSRI